MYSDNGMGEYVLNSEAQPLTVSVNYTDALFKNWVDAFT